MLDLDRYLSRLRKDECGTIAILFGASIFVILLVVGLAIDGARAYSVSTRVTAALDSAALAAGKMLDDEDYSDVEIQDRAASFFTAHWSTIPINGLVLSAPHTTVDRQNFEIRVMVDISLKSTFGQLAGVDRFNFQRDATVVYRIKKVELAMALDITGSMCDPCVKIEGLKQAAKDVVDQMLDGTHPPGSMKIAIAPYSAAVNAGSFAAAVSGGASIDGCVVERNTGDTFTDAGPSVGNRLGTQASSPPNPNYSCPASSIVPMSEDRNLLRSKIDALATGGWTAGQIGAAWGWYLVSPNWASIFPRGSRGRSYSDRSTIKSVLIMSDGIFNTSYLPAGQNSEDRLVQGSAPYQAIQLCDAMKARNIEVWTVAFQAPAASETLLRDCATDAGHFFAAATTNELRDAFRAVAQRLTNLRLAR